MQPRNYYLYPVCWAQSESKKWFCTYQGDKNLIWRKKTKDGRHDQNILRTFLKIDAAWDLILVSSVLNNKWIENAVLQISGWQGMDERRRPCAAAPSPADETVQKQKDFPW